MRLRLVAILSLVLSGAGLAGCAAVDSPSNGDAEPSDVQYDAIEALIGEPIQPDGTVLPDTMTAINIRRLAATTGTDGREPMPSEGYIETAVKGDYAYLSRSGPEQGLVVFDISDIAEPTQVGFIALDAGFEADIEVSDDGEWGFWETQRFPTSAQGPNVLEPGANAPHGIHVVDLSDKTDPTWVSFTPILPDGPHSITYANITGRHIVFASTYAFAYAYAQVAPPMMQRLVILELDTSGPIPQLVTLAEYADPLAEEAAIYPASGEMFPHDVAFQVHPVTGQALAYVSYWDLGVVILDVSDPANPVKVGQANDFGPTPYGDIHMARPFQDLIGGRHVTVTEPEISGQEDSGYLTFFDTTDPANPTYISRWKIPGNVTNAASGGPHYFDVRDGRLVIAHYAAGFWVVDVHDEANLLNPRTVGYALSTPAEEGGLPVVGALGGGVAFDAWWVDERHIVASETGTGLVVMSYDGPIPPAR